MAVRQQVIPGLGERVSFGGVGALGYALESVGDPEIWTKLTGAQQTWVVDTLVKLNELIVNTTHTSCPTWAPAIDRASGCFQAWFNAAKMGFTKQDGSLLVLRTDGVFDQDTLDALRTVAALNPQDFKTPFPGTSLPGPEKKGLSTGAMVGIGVAGVAAVGGIAYVAMGGKKKKRRR